ncbi:transcriptional regulator, DeoR family [Coriobacterium glomerans PW2]|uniref:Transcriptional regulator, DeoR family n=1 Tax=Coriobacterium glomerans (strain ATCC 49209 / DSM 20642 / JCM 10262 / PW2) TaxID=700015 RepID=F2NBE9_CORGP|nr:sugar-binding domain-containing protein [Coriobacterium glomerans]AEB06685.1 transcriptional regulator, DeoR family [Coriobacterium glomerans PW2]
MMQPFSRRELLAHVAQDFYHGKHSIADLSSKYEMSRYLITKALDEALTTGVVTIQINAPVSRNYQLESALKRRFDIAHIAVVREIGDVDRDVNSILEYSAERIQMLIRKAHVIGLSWGSTVFSVIEHFADELREDLTFTQFMGENMKYHSKTGSKRMVELAAAHYEANYATLPAPLYVVSDLVRAALPEEPALRPTLALARRMDMLFCSLGTLDSLLAIPAWKSARAELFPAVESGEVAGMLFGRPYDINGVFLTAQKDTTVGLTLDEIMATPRRIGMVKSKFKTDATLGALRGGLLTELILTEGIARRVLVADDEQS